MARVMISDRIVTVFGGSGFIGRHVVRALAESGWRVRNAVRRPDLANHLQPLGAVGQIQSIQANLRNEASIARAIEGSDAVVNLVGILNESGRQTFDAVNAQGARRVAEAAKAAGITAFVHMSALGADPASPSAYARSKAAGEAAVLETIPGAIILRPSVVFGPEDDFLNKFAALARISPVLPLIGGGNTRMQPVFAGDVGEAVAAALPLETPKLRAGVYELGGPEVLTMREIMEYVLKVTCRRRALVSLPFGIARMQASLLQILPKPLLTVDQVKLLERDNVVSDDARAAKRTLENIGIRPTTLEAVVPQYLYRFRRAGQFTDPAGA